MSAKAKKAVVGDDVEIPKDVTIGVGPDGAAFTVRQSYRVTAPGKHVFGSLTVEVEAPPAEDPQD